MMVDDIILKGQGVSYEDEDGNLTPMSFPERDDINPFFAVPGLDGETFDEDEYPHKWPMEAVAIKLAHAMMRGSPGRFTYEKALEHAMEILNQSARDFNLTADDAHKIPAYFKIDSNGKPIWRDPITGKTGLNPHWARVNYGYYQDKKKHEDVGKPRSTRNMGGVVTFHVNNSPHPVFGHFPESGAFPSFTQLQKILSKWLKNYGVPIPTTLTQYPHVEPQDQVTSGDGTEFYSADNPDIKSIVRRHQTTDADPFGPYGQTFMERHSRQNVRVHDILGGLDPVFLESRDTPFSPYTAMNLRSKHGLNREEAEYLAGTPAGAFWNAGRLRGDRHALVKPTNALKERLMQIGGLTPEELQRLIQSHVRGYRAISMEEIGISRKNGTNLLEALALSQIAREYDAHSPEEAEHGFARQSIGAITGPTQDVTLEPKEQTDSQIQTAHIRGSKPHNLSDYLPNLSSPQTVETPGEVRPGQTGRRFGEPLGQYAQERVGADTPTSTVIEQSHDTLHSLMENLQMADARLDSSIMKSVPYDRDHESIAMAYSISISDVVTIEQSLGDWDRIAKSLMMSPLVVKGVKVSLG